ncbi:hypothetical protein M9H77_29696 [Catharanthus roseus]|uniref:Uncharacterized protein n=1 Tax=Catharanthus roseus TaxID=4058 RepID=A0ACB9ZVJ4_CATRO|nr:hypothetical protein M9H77_29696 [Catharanthus roseus]
MKEKRPSHSKIKSLETLKTLKTLSMLECNKLVKSESFCLRTGHPIFTFTVKNYYRYTECNGYFFKKDLRLLPIEELMGSLLTYEMKIKRLNEMEDEEKEEKALHSRQMRMIKHTHQTMKIRLMMMRKWH